MVEEFIERFNSSDIKSNFLDGYCYYFAVMLKIRFSEGSIYYLPIENHFVFGLNNKFYDVTGEVNVAGKVIYLWSEYIKMDKVHSKRIIRDCILKVVE